MGSTRRTTWNRLVKCGLDVLCVMAVVMHAACPMCHAAEGGVGIYWPGFRNFQTGIVPSKPGFYLRNDVVGYTASAPRVVLNDLPVENISVDIAGDVVEPAYVFPRKLFGANHAILLTQPFLWVNQSGGIIGTDITPSGSRFAPGDTVISPFYLGWNKGKLHYNANLAIFIPTAEYDITRVVNVGKNYWALDPEFAVTYLNPATGWEISGALGYTIAFENPATQYNTGDILHMDYAVGRAMRNGVKPGIMGYAVIQVTPDTGAGAIFGSFESNVFGIGPIVQWPAGKGRQMSFRYLHEFGARNHLEGEQFAFLLRVTF